jgi:agmatine deiminase
VLFRGQVSCPTWTDDRRDPVRHFTRRIRSPALARDARGRRFKIHKLIQPGPLFMTKEEAAGVDRAEGTRPRTAVNGLPAHT